MSMFVKNFAYVIVLVCQLLYFDLFVLFEFSSKLKLPKKWTIIILNGISVKMKERKIPKLKMKNLPLKVKVMMNKREFQTAHHSNYYHHHCCRRRLCCCCCCYDSYFSFIIDIRYLFHFNILSFCFKIKKKKDVSRLKKKREKNGIKYTHTHI